MNFAPGSRASYLNDLARKAKELLNRGELDEAAKYLRNPDAAAAAEEASKKRTR